MVRIVTITLAIALFYVFDLKQTVKYAKAQTTIDPIGTSDLPPDLTGSSGSTQAQTTVPGGSSDSTQAQTTVPVGSSGSTQAQPTVPGGSSGSTQAQTTVSPASSSSGSPPLGSSSPVTSSNAQSSSTTQATTQTPFYSLACTDYSTKVCKYWADKGACGRAISVNGKPIKVSCPVSCKVCCSDTQNNCLYWANKCDRLASQDRHPCSKTCGLC